MIIALTGNIGCGKSTALEIFRKSGYKIINADIIGHELYTIKEVKNKVVKTFGKKILSKGKIDRKKLKQIVFYNPAKLKQLNSITHPLIIDVIKEIIKQEKNKKINPKILIEAALIIEFKFKDYDKLILITIDKKEQVKRLLKKAKYNKEEIENIIASQIPQNKKIKYADYIIDNSESKKEFKKNIKKLIKNIDSI